MSSIKRITNEIREIKKLINSDSIDNHRFIDIIVDQQNINQMTIICLGPKETPYEEILNTLSVSIPSEYPFSAPKIKFINKIFHPNISTDGQICLDVLKDKWSPVFTLRTILISILSLLSDPNPASPLNGDAANMYTDSKKTQSELKKYIKKIFSISTKEL
jgi:ubiquitin-protein ligase